MPYDCMPRSCGHVLRQVQCKLKPYLVLYQSSLDIKLTLVALLYTLLCFFLVCLANAYADRIYFTYFKPTNVILVDPGMSYLNSYFKSWNFNYKITDAFVALSVVWLLVLLISYQSKCSQLFRRVLFIIATMYLIRAPTIIMTVLPNPNVECKDHRHTNLFVDALLLLIQDHQACGDIFFSGHAIPITVSARMYFMYTYHWLPKLLIFIFSSLGLLSLVMSTLHYSIDVLYSVFLTSLVFSLYHWTIHEKLGHSQLGQFIRYLDSGVSTSTSSLQRRRVQYTCSEYVPPFHPPPPATCASLPRTPTTLLNSNGNGNSSLVPFACPSPSSSFTSSSLRTMSASIPPPPPLVTSSASAASSSSQFLSPAPPTYPPLPPLSPLHLSSSTLLSSSSTSSSSSSSSLLSTTSTYPPSSHSYRPTPASILTSIQPSEKSSSSWTCDEVFQT